MRKIIFAILLVMSVLSQAQTVWTVETVPNTRLKGNDIHVSDPDQFLSDSAEAHINTALCAIREQADVFLVTLGSIGQAEPKRFATTLFNKWGIGDADADNGVLLLFVEDQHALEFETGYGAEEILTDAKCERIFTKTIVPFFKKGDYETGLCAGVADIVSVYGGTIPDGLKATLPDEEIDDESDSLLEDIGINGVTLAFLLIMMFLPLAGFIFWVVKLGIKDKTVKQLYNGTDEGDAVYVDAIDTEWTGSPWAGMGCCGGMLIGLSVFLCGGIAFIILSEGFPQLGGDALDIWWVFTTLFLYLTFVSFCHNQRLMRISKKIARKSLAPKKVYQTAMGHTSNQIAMWMAPWIGVFYFLVLKSRIKRAPEYACPTCGSPMQSDEGFVLPEKHQKEAQLGVLSFKPYRCGNGHHYVLKEKGGDYANFTVCSECGAYTCKQTSAKIVREASYSQSGEKQVTYVCLLCGATTILPIVIPKLVHYSSSSGGGHSSSSGHSHSSYHHSSHGSFGGGHSGGGGFSGRW